MVNMNKELLYPYTFDNRTPTLVDFVLFIPEFFTEDDLKRHSLFCSEDLNRIFKHPCIYVEYCAGNGQWIVEMAKSQPDVLWIAVEKKFERVKKIYKRAQLEGISNLLIAFGTAEDFTKYYLPSAVVKQVFVNFPDPWPKKKHAKHRLFQDDFLNDVKRVCACQSVMTLATDDVPYLDEAVAAMSQSHMKPFYKEPFYKPLDSNHGYSFFEDLWKKKGKINYQTKFIIHD